jgi:cytochrome c oxidase cbb3-type subunit I/II
MQTEKFYYDNKIVRNFSYAAIVFGLIGMTVGLLIALQLVFPQLNFGIPYTTYGRVRPLHTNAVIFAFVGNGIFAGVYYSLQRLCKTRMFSDVLSNINFWGWQIIILAAAVSLPLGLTTGKEYAELEWPIDIAITLIWVVFGWNMFGTILKRRERHLYVAIWFYIATFVTVAVLHLVNSFELPISLFKSYSWYAGVQDALVQWWYGHNAVAFFLTTPYLGLMYYFVPKAANRPVYSYKLSIIHFWALIFLYIWAGPHHLLYTSLPDWAQSLGVVFSVMLIAPSWGGMINGLLTLRGVWDKVREDVILKLCKRNCSLYRLDCSTRTRGCIRLERILNIWYVILVVPSLVRKRIIFKKISKLPFLDWHFRYFILRNTIVLGRYYTKFNVERIYCRWFLKISKLLRNSNSNFTNVCNA